MPTDCVSYQNSGFFPDLIVDYLNQNIALKPLYNNFPTVENFASQINEKSLNFDFEKRQILANSLQTQYHNFDISKTTENNIALLRDENTFTITTGHQLNLFTGPMYFLYKIVSVINLCKKLKTEYPNKNFVPIYWMATEDHDFDEINFFNFKGKKIVWNSEENGPVGRFSTDGLRAVYKAFETELGSGINAEYLKNLFQKSYLAHENLADATRFLANDLFGKYGLVIIDGDDKNLKQEFIPFVHDELIDRKSVEKVQATIDKLGNYKIQVNPREINLFYIENGLRERIVFENQKYKIHNTDIVFTQDEILSELHKSPEKFSPNVILRPLYQEVILPNLCYVGGGGEIAYWLELKSMFDYHKITFPMLLVRNSVVIATEKQAHKTDHLNLLWQDLFLKSNLLIDKKTKELSDIKINLETQKIMLRKQFADLYAIAEQTDKSFSGAVKAQEAKQIKGLENLEKRLLKAQKRKYHERLLQIVSLKNELFPNDGLQERTANFSMFYDEQLIEKLIYTLKPLSQDFEILLV